IVMDKVVHAQLALLPLVENLQRSDMDPIENAIAFKKILDDNIVESQNELAEKVGVSKSWLSKTLSILRLPSSLLSKIQADHYSDITVLSALNKVPEEQLDKVYGSIKTMQRNDALEAIKKVISKPTKSKENIVVLKNKVVINTTGLSKEKQDKLKLLLKGIEQLLEK
ncbi:MAG: KorB domain-containing protein, partial [Sulfuricurvum sp.]